MLVDCVPQALPCLTPAKCVASGSQQLNISRCGVGCLAWHTCREHQGQLLQEHFSLDYKQVVPSECLLYGNYLVPGAEPKVCCCAGWRW